MEKMRFEQFADMIVNNIKDYLPGSFADASVELQKMTKINDVVLTGLTIRSIYSNISPSIYLDQYYQYYLDGSDMNDILRDIADERIAHEVRDDFDVSRITDFQRVKDSIVPRIISEEWNKALLELRPHTDVADLAVTYHIVLHRDETGTSSIPITYQLLESWGVGVGTLHEVAVRNMTDMLPSTLESLSSVLSSFIGAGPCGNPSDDPCDGLNDTLFVLSNIDRVNGSSAILDKAMMDSIVERFGEGFYLLPSSVHEWLILASGDGINPSILTDMVQQVNAGEVAIEERLSSHVYRYTASEGLICA